MLLLLLLLLHITSQTFTSFAQLVRKVNRLQKSFSLAGITQLTCAGECFTRLDGKLHKVIGGALRKFSSFFIVDIGSAWVWKLHFLSVHYFVTAETFLLCFQRLH
jgi:hypothetical protein